MNGGTADGMAASGGAMNGTTDGTTMEHVAFDAGGAGAGVQASRFRARGGAEELHLSVVGPAGATFERGLAAVEAAYREALGRLDLPPSSAVFRRVFVSDAANQAAAVRGSSLGAAGEGAGPVAVSVVEQPPLPERKLALWAYHVHDPAGLRKDAVPGGVALRRGGLGHLWVTDLGHAGTNGDANPLAQTRRIFATYEDLLAAQGADLARHAIRTWLFVQNVDVNYAGMVKGRIEVFDRSGLTADTHYIASTGIEGRHADPARLVNLDAYAIPGVGAGQVRYLQAPDHLGPTHLYGVTFERGVAVDHGDRRHVLVSGTASIEPGGRTLHPGDVGRQVERTFANVEALLADAGAGPADLAHLIVYLRDPADRGVVEAFVRARYPRVPWILVRAPVCRPDWLVEAECVAIRGVRNPGLAAF